MPEQALVERLHAVVLALGDDLLDLVGLVGVHDLVEDATGRHEDLHRRDAAAASPLDEALADDARAANRRATCAPGAARAAGRSR